MATAPPIAGSDSGHVLRRVSETIAALIRAAVPELAADDAVSFDSPADLDGQGRSRLSLFLYHIGIDGPQRNQPATLTLAPGADGHPAGLRTVMAPASVSLGYMLVPFARSTELELVIADRLVRLFHVVRALAAPILPADLIDAGNDEIGIRPTPLSIDAQRNLWAIFPGRPYKLTLAYTVSPVVIPADHDRSIDMVVQAILQQRQMRDAA
ncbi:hypothetical protein ASE86_11215 [Sphingomonas sp. Leaf33]|uniref:DUF4255 domain-containing protein n=1 Tax=Sphingomonas sp. Leaf33 TaxID=1736215 RepID=UPI0006FC833A|nr:DUF4255 domain-containing protein [Sphingomonas sp. Leaf33]KQN26635.1 hypothetical protein ASE86_11215 [Sphingomonas sp. Leaf33]